MMRSYPLQIKVNLYHTVLSVYNYSEPSVCKSRTRDGLPETILSLYRLVSPSPQRKELSNNHLFRQWFTIFPKLISFLLIFRLKGNRHRLQQTSLLFRQSEVNLQHRFKPRTVHILIGCCNQLGDRNIEYLCEAAEHF